MSRRSSRPTKRLRRGRELPRYERRLESPKPESRFERMGAVRYTSKHCGQMMGSTPLYEELTRGGDFHLALFLRLVVASLLSYSSALFLGLSSVFFPNFGRFAVFYYPVYGYQRSLISANASQTLPTYNRFHLRARSCGIVDHVRLPVCKYLTFVPLLVNRAYSDLISYYIVSHR